MKKILPFLFGSFLLFNSASFGQTTMVPHKAGHVFQVSLPEYLSETKGLNSAAAIQYKSVVKDVYGLVIFDTKKELSLVDMNFTSINEFYDEFIEDFLKEEEKRNVSKLKSSSKGDIKFIESDVSYFDKDAETEIYYLVGIVETKTAYYKVLSYCALQQKDKFKADFQKILYSLND